MTDNKDESQNFCGSCTEPVANTDVECPNCGFGLRTQPQPLSVGAVLEGRYRIDAVVGRGGTGVVYKGTDLTLSREIAVKALLEQSANPVTLARFLHEARNLASVEHRGLVPVYAVGQEGGAHYMVMKYIDGSTLADLIKQQGALPETTVRKILIETCDAVHTLHTAGLIHRDIKPANLMIGKDGRVSVVDLGIVQRVTEKHETSGQGAGTPKYMAPELFSATDVTLRADIYSMGIVGFHSLAGHPPFDGPTPMAVLYKQAHEAPPELSKLGLKISPAMSQVIHKAMSKKPQDRYATARDFADALAGRDKKQSKAGLVIGLLLVSLLGLGLYFGTGQGGLSPLPTTVQPTAGRKVEPARSITPTSTIEAKRKVPVSVKVELQAGFPEHITLELTNGETVETPHFIEALEGAPKVTLKASASGYQDKMIDVSFENNAQLAIILKKKALKASPRTGGSGFQLKPLEYED
jgi:serine/threonine protein kinase